MAYDTGAVIATIKSKSNAASFSDALITSYIQAKQDEILGRHILSFMEATATPTLVQGDVSYAYPADFQSVLGLRLTDPSNTDSFNRPDYMPFRQFDSNYPNPAVADQGWPQIFSDFARVLYWSCPLDKAYLMQLKYLRKPTELTSSSVVPDIPREFSEILVRAGRAGVEEYRQNYDIAAVHERKAEDLTEDLIGRYSSRQLIALGKATTSRKPSRDSVWR